MSHDKNIRIYDLHDPSQYADERAYWDAQSAAHKLAVLEQLRSSAHKLGNNESRDGDVPTFEEFFAFLNSNEVRYLVVGGYAIAVHANPRYTDDLEIFIARNRENATLLPDALKDFGFGESGLDCDGLMKPNQVIQLGRPPFRIDLLTSIDGVEFEEAWPNRFKGEYGAQSVFFIGREELIRNKKASGRVRDLADLDDLSA